MRYQLAVNGITTTITAYEMKAAMKAVLKARRGGAVMKRDLQAYEFARKGLSNAEIGRAMGISARSVKAGIQRVESGRYPIEVEG